MITNPLIIAGGVELGLVLFTMILLLQPKFIFREVGHSRTKSVSTWSGMVLLCMTFCWSVIFGAVLFLNHLVIRL